MDKVNRVLFVASEAAPLVKVGGLADVIGGLPVALQKQGLDVRILLPGYNEAFIKAGSYKVVSSFNLVNKIYIQIFQCTLPETDVIVWLVDSNKQLFGEVSKRYSEQYVSDSREVAERFAVLAHIAEMVSLNKAGLNWRPDVVHCNDWQTGLVPALLAIRTDRPATVFTIHNLVYKGLFSFDTYEYLVDRNYLPGYYLDKDIMEFSGQISFLKVGIVYADMVNTVSPTHSKEICTAELGCGFDELLKKRRKDLVGILNGVNYKDWDPSNDSFILRKYNFESIGEKGVNKHNLQSQLGLPLKIRTPLIGMLGRLVIQKGIDLVIDILPELLDTEEVQFVALGIGDKDYQSALLEIQSRYPEKVAIHIGFSEKLAHIIEAGADMLLMPSRFEPCGLTQIYGLRYGTIPIVTNKGGLADTVIDATTENLELKKANGFVFSIIDSKVLKTTLERALSVYYKPGIWKEIIRQGMLADFSWVKSAHAYIDLYDRAYSMRNSNI